MKWKPTEPTFNNFDLCITMSTFAREPEKPLTINHCYINGFLDFVPTVSPVRLQQVLATVSMTRHKK